VEIEAWRNKNKEADERQRQAMNRCQKSEKFVQILLENANAF
jgi:hypothetical protein